VDATLSSESSAQWGAWKPCRGGRGPVDGDLPCIGLAVYRSVSFTTVNHVIGAIDNQVAIVSPSRDLSAVAGSSAAEEERG
jgi:hypothetical protein